MFAFALASDNSSQTHLCHRVFVEGEGDVNAAAVCETPGCGRGLMGGAPALPLARAGLGEAACVWDGDTQVTCRTWSGESVPIEAAGRRSAVELKGAEPL